MFNKAVVATTAIALAAGFVPERCDDALRFTRGAAREHDRPCIEAPHR